MKARLGLLAAVLVSSLGLGTQQPPPLKEPTTVFLVLSGPRMSAMYHRQGCEWLTASGGSWVISLKDAKAKYFQPHGLCMTGQDTVPSCTSAANVSTAAVSVLTPRPTGRPSTNAAGDQGQGPSPRAAPSPPPGATA